MCAYPCDTCPNVKKCEANDKLADKCPTWKAWERAAAEAYSATCA